MVSDGNREFLAEVKGHKKSAQREDIRQIDESLDTHEKKFNQSMKGVLIVNAWQELPVHNREDNRVSFPADVVKRAEAIDVALVSGMELLNALRLFWTGQRTGAEIFNQIFESVGVVKFQ